MKHPVLSVVIRERFLYGPGLFGAKYAATPRFAMFRELGLGYTRSTSSGILSSDSKSNDFGTRAGVGVILYFWL